MKITLGSKALLQKLQFVGAVISTSSTIPALDNFLFNIDNSSLQITASDLETTITASLQVDSDEKTTISIHAKTLLDVLKAFPDQPLTFTTASNSILEISSDIGNYSLPYSDGSDYPKHVVVSDAQVLDMSSQVLATALSKTIFATANDDLRPTLSGILFELTTNGSNFVATDAHKLVKYSRSDIKSDAPINFIVPRKPAAIIKSILSNAKDQVSIEFNDSNAVFGFEDYRITCRLTDGKYPNYNAVIPKNNDKVMIVDRQQLLNSVRCVSIFSNRMTHQVKLSIKGAELQISAEDVDYSNKADERITCNYNGSDIEIGFNAKILIEMLSNLSSSSVEIKLSEPTKAGIMKPFPHDVESEELLMLIMPLKIN